MSYQAIVLYPNPEDIKFDLNYYLTKHMPLVFENWQQYGLKEWSVIEFGPGLDGSRSQYAIGASLVWDNAEQQQKAVASDSASKVFGDVPNFTNQQPVFLSGKVVGTPK